MLYKIPIFAVKSDNLGERGAHRVAYQDFLIEIVFPQDQYITGSCNTSSGTSSIEAASPHAAESTVACCFRRIGYIAVGYLAVRLISGIVKK